MQKYTYICWIHSDAMNNRRRKTSLTNIYLSLYCKGSKRVTQGLRVRGSWRPNINYNILTPLLWPSTLCLSYSPDAGVHSAGCWLSLLHLISIFSGPQLIRASSPFGLVWLSQPHLVHLRLQLSATQLVCWTQLSYIIVRRPLDLWNQMFNRHQAEITVMQFTGHSLPVHQSMSLPWEFFSSSHFVSQFPPTRFPLLTAIGMCHFLPVHHLGMAFLAGSKGQNITYKAIKRYFHLYTSFNYLFTNPSARAGYDTRSIFKRSLIGFNWEYSFS